jgi:hypothetical protein
MNVLVASTPLTGRINPIASVRHSMVPERPPKSQAITIRSVMHDKTKLFDGVAATHDHW